MTRKVIAAMRISSFFYSIKQGIKNIWRNKMFSVASIATMCACIFLFGLFYSIVENFQSMVKEAEEGVAVSVFFNEGISQEQIDEITESISEAKASNGEHFTIKQMEKTKKNLEVRLAKLNDAGKKDNAVTFEQLGVDRLFVQWWQIHCLILIN